MNYLYKCKLCSTVCKTLKTLKFHCHVHLDKYKFSKINNNDKLYISYKLTYKCSVCPKISKHKHKILNHLSKHTNDNFKCKCGRTYNNNSSFITHKVNCKSYSLFKKFKCPKCNKAFSYFGVYLKHFSSHY